MNHTLIKEFLELLMQSSSTHFFRVSDVIQGIEPILESGIGEDHDAFQGVLEKMLSNGGIACLGADQFATISRSEYQNTIIDIVRELVLRMNFPEQIWRYFEDVFARFKDNRSAADSAIPFLLVLLHEGKVKEIKGKKELLLKKYKTVIALSVMIDLEVFPSSSRNSVISARDSLQIDIRNDKQDFLKTVFEIVDQTWKCGNNRRLQQGFENTHQIFCHTMIDDLRRERVDWQERQRRSIPLFYHPTREDIQGYYQIGYFNGLITSQNASIDSISTEIVRIRSEIVRLSQIHTEQNRQRIAELRDNLQGLKDYKAKLVTALENYKREHDRLTRRLRDRGSSGVSRRERVEQYLELLSSQERVPEMEVERDDFLRSLDELLLPLRDILFPQRVEDYLLNDGSNDDKWSRYNKILDNLIKGYGTKRDGVSVELLIDAFLQVYGTINTDRDIGIRGAYHGHTYAGHPEDAVDIIAASGTEIYSVPPIVLSIPNRFPDTPRSLFYYVQFEVTSAHEGSDAEDMLGKIANGLDNKSNNPPIFAQCNQTADTSMPVKLLTQNINVELVLLGLCAREFTEEAIPAEYREKINADANEILADWEALINPSIGLARDTPLFRREYSLRTGSVGIDSVILRGPKREIKNKAKAVLVESIEEWNQLVEAWENTTGTGESAEKPDLCSPDLDLLIVRLCRLMVLLYSIIDEFHRNTDQSVRIEHSYQNPYDSSSPPVVVEVFYTHLQSIDPSVIEGNSVAYWSPSPVGKVGLTGGAVSSHLHLEIRLSRGGDDIGALFPHEFFLVSSASTGYRNECAPLPVQRRRDYIRRGIISS